MRSNRELALAVRRALATGTIALCGAGVVAAYAQPAPTTQPSTTQVSAAKTSTPKTATAKVSTAKAPLRLAQATTVPGPATASTAAPLTLQTVIVTGTMIARPAAETAEAITILKADALKDQGITNVEQALNTLTSNTPGLNISSAVGTFSGGGTYANLRNLGAGRTLVLLDGQRLAPNAFNGPASFSSGDGAVDLSGIPFSAIQSVEVLREGASALYGSDAIAGVINFKTKRNYQGLEVEGNFDHPQERGGGSIQGDVTFGHGDLVSDGYNFMITGSFQHQQEIQATWRSFSAQGYDAARGVTNTNDPGTWPGTFVDSVGNFWQPNYPSCPGNPFLVIDPANLGNTCSYRYSAATDDVPDSKETSGLLQFTKSLPANNQVQLQYFYTRSELTAWAGPMFYALPISDTNPYIPAPSALTCETACTVNGPNALTPGAPTATPILNGGYAAIWSDPLNNRYAGNVNNAQRALLTFSGTNAGWDYTVAGNYSQNKNDDRNISGYPDETVLAPTGAKLPTFGSPGVPGVLSDLINPFGPQSAAGQALINSSYVAGTYQLGEDKRWDIDGHASHELGDAFGAGTPATVALGLTAGGEHYEYHTTLYNDISSAATGLSDSHVSKSRQFQAAFVEIDVPMTKSLDVDVADREDRYSDFGRTNNAKLSVRYQPASFLTLRGTASTGFRAPTLNDLYSPNSIAASTSGTMGQGNPDCPAGGAAIAPFTTATCTTQGLGVTGGNSKLTPETSQNFDFGIVLSPIRDMGITLDYYRILLKNTIGTIPAAAMYADPSAFTPYYVLSSVAGYPPLTPSVDSATSCIPFTKPTCGYLLLTNQNTGRSTTDGFDLSIQYLQHTPIGTFHEDLEGTAVTKFLIQQYNGGPERNLVGWFNHLPPAYRWQHDLRIDWASPQGMWGAGLANRFYSSYIDQFKDGNGNQRIVGSYSLVDIYASVKPIHNLTVLFGIKNVLDRNPPYTNASENNFTAGYNVLVVDPLMRNFYVNVKYDIF